MRHIIRSTMGMFLLATVMACGGGGGGAATEGDPNAVPVSGSGGGEEASASAGTAGSGDPCDFGGATHMTCQGALVCCYPEQGEVEYGSCTVSCPGYD